MLRRSGGDGKFVGENVAVGGETLCWIDGTRVVMVMMVG